MAELLEPSRISAKKASRNWMAKFGHDFRRRRHEVRGSQNLSDFDASEGQASTAANGYRFLLKSSIDPF
jgi:hypothetical protein